MNRRRPGLLAAAAFAVLTGLLLAPGAATAHSTTTPSAREAARTTPTPTRAYVNSAPNGSPASGTIYLEAFRQGRGGEQCSGAFVGKNVVVTAGHCFGAAKYKITKVNAFFGEVNPTRKSDDSYTWRYECHGVGVWTPYDNEKDLSTPDPDDLAVIRLGNTCSTFDKKAISLSAVRHNVYSFGYETWGASHSGEFVYRGYPGNEKNGTMVSVSGIKPRDTNWWYVTAWDGIDLAPGASGGAVAALDPNDHKWYVDGVYVVQYHPPGPMSGHAMWFQKFNNDMVTMIHDIYTGNDAAQANRKRSFA